MNSVKQTKKCLLIDDEFHALELTANYIERLEGYEVAYKIRNPILAEGILAKEKIDLVFLDINMPQMNGMELLQKIPSNVVVIFTTAYTEHAAKAFDMSAADYLVKPYSFERFLKAIEKAERFFDTSESDKTRKLKIRHDKSWVFLHYDEIIYVEGKKEYIKIVTTEGSYLTLMSLSKLEIELPSSEFIRIHKSYLVAISKISKYNKTELELINKTVLPVSRNRGTEVLDKLKESSQ